MRLSATVATSVIVASLAAGCSTANNSGSGSSDPGVASQVSSGFASQKNVIVHDSTCNESTDADHFTCDLTYETPEGAMRNATVLVTCDPDRCVWREQ